MATTVDDATKLSQLRIHTRGDVLHVESDATVAEALAAWDGLMREPLSYLRTFNMAGEMVLVRVDAVDFVEFVPESSGPTVH